MKSIHGTGDIEVLKFREVTVDSSARDLKWNYYAHSPNRYFEREKIFGDQTYETIDLMALSISKAISFEESIRIVDGKAVTKIHPEIGIQFSRLDDDEMLELTKKIIFYRSGNFSRPGHKLEEVVK